MKLIYDKFEDVWVWVDSKNEHIQLSPEYVEEHSAIVWFERMKKLMRDSQ